MPSSWGEISNQLNKEQADKRQREADEQARRERAYAAKLEEVAKVEHLVQDFLRAARSVGNRGAKLDEYYEEVGWLFKTRKYVKY